MYGTSSAAPAPHSSVPSAAGTHHPFHGTPACWNTDDIAYVGQELYQNVGGCSQKTSASFEVANTGGCSQNRPPSSSATGGQGLPEPLRAAADAIRLQTGLRELHPLPAGSFPPTSSPPTSGGNGRSSRGRREVAILPATAGPQRHYCQVEGCLDMAASVDASSPAVLCEGHIRDGMQRIEHNDRIYGRTRCERKTEARQASQDSGIKAKLEPTESKTVPAKTAHCEYPGCGRTSRYGLEGGPLNFCQSHKRTGMYTNRKGNILIATRDGDAFRAAEGTAASAVLTAPSGEDLAAKPGQIAPHESGGSEVHSAENSDSPSSSSSQMIAPLHRKLCEVEGCQVQPSYGPSGTSRPRFCSGHKSKGMVGLKNRPCLFPGCDTRPHYGLSMGRPVYCASHKKHGMVHLLKESMSIEKERISRNREHSRKNVAEKKRREAVSKHDIVGDNEEWTEETEQRARKRGEKGRSTKGKGKTKFSGAGWSGRKGGSMVSRAPLSPGSSSSWGSTSPSRDEEASFELDYDSEAAASTTRSPRNSRVVDTSGMAPSVEIRLLQEARESARAEAEASGSGRRPRAPSRKLLEASGALENQGAQWMTKEIKEADARVKKELREQRKHFKAAGLKAGEVIEAIAEPRGGNGEVEQKRAKASLSDDSGVSENHGMGWTPPTRHNSRQLTTCETMRGGEMQTTGSGGENPTSRPEDEVVAPSPESASPFPIERTWTVSEGVSGLRKGSPVDERATSTKAKRSRFETCRGDVKEELAVRTAERNENTCNKKARVGEGGGEHGVVGAGDETGGKVQCERRDCSKTATFGVNGTVRYCKLHRLFGMHEIIQSS